MGPLWMVDGAQTDWGKVNKIDGAAGQTATN